MKNEGDSAAATKAQVNVNAKTGTEKQSQKQSGKDSTDNAENKMKNDTNTNAVANAIANANAKNTCSDNKVRATFCLPWLVIKTKSLTFAFVLAFSSFLWINKL